MIQQTSIKLKPQPLNTTANLFRISWNSASYPH